MSNRDFFVIHASVLMRACLRESESEREGSERRHLHHRCNVFVFLLAPLSEQRKVPPTMQRLVSS